MMLEFQQKAVRRCLEAAIQLENGLRGFVERLKHDNEENPTLKKAVKDVEKATKTITQAAASLGVTREKV